MKIRLLVCLLFAVVMASVSAGEPSPARAPVVGTFSIIARDPATGEIGVAVQSRVIAVGAIVPYAKAGVGAVATQAWANPTYGPRGLELLQAGKKPQEIIEQLTTADSERAQRQLGILSVDGDAANFTGADCLEWAGGKIGKDCCVQGNILAGEDVVSAMVASFESSHGELGERLLQALEAGQRAGGDRRGMQSAALLIVRKGWGYAGLDDKYRDLRVDEHPTPIAELRRIYELHRKLFPPPQK